jgi:endonuclease YncB( thermonuclease family)
VIVAPNYIFKGIVTRVIDGDTLVMTVSPAFKIQLVEYKFRLHGIDTHELNSTDLGKRKLAVEAKEVVRAAVEGKEVLVRTIKNTKGADHIDSFGRYLVEIFYSDPKDGRQINLNQELLDLGLAIKWAD